MSSSLRRGALAASAIVFSIASLAACGAGNNAQTLEVKPDNAAIHVGDIKIQNAVVITQPDLKATGPAVISATLFNGGLTDQTLQSVTVTGSGTSAQLKAAKGQSLTVPAGGSLILGGKGNASAVLPSGREAVQDGDAQRITFTLSKTGKVGLNALVVPATSYFGQWGPSQIPSASPAGGSTVSGSATASPTTDTGGKPGKGDTASASASAPAAAGTPSDSASESTAGH